MFLVKNSRTLAIILGIALAVVEVVSAFFLPDKIVMQLHMDGTDGLIMPKVPGLLIFFLLSSALLWRMTSVETAKDKKTWLIASLFVMFINVVVILYNVMY